MSILFYKRPDYVRRPPGPLDGSSCQRMVEKTHANKNSIPESIGFDRIIDESSLPPCSLSDFMDYLVYITHDAENLQFFLWSRDYTKRFSALKDVEKMLSPEWDPNLPPTHLDTLTLTQSSTEPASEADDLPTAMEAHLHRNQPFREEIERMISHYLILSSPRELNLSHRDRIAVLRALKHTTHPSALATVVALVETTLRNQLHPNFVRWTICNGNKPKVTFVRGMGTFFTTIALTMTIILCVSHVSRWWRIFCFIPYFMGIATLTSAYKGLCIILHHNGNQRSIRPWEDLTIASHKASCDSLGSNLESQIPPISKAEAVRPVSSSTTLATLDKEKSGLPKSKWLNTFGSKNKFDGESWIQKWNNRPLLQRIMEPTTRVHEEGVRIMQDKIVKQSQLWGLLGASLFTIVIVAMPKGNRF